MPERESRTAEQTIRCLKMAKIKLKKAGDEYREALAAAKAAFGPPGDAVRHKPDWVDAEKGLFTIGFNISTLPMGGGYVGVAKGHSWAEAIHDIDRYLKDTGGRREGDHLIVSEHPEISFPSDPEEKIWRYMLLSRFEQLIESRTLWLARADTFDDVLEGSMSLPNLEVRKQRYKTTDFRLFDRKFSYEEFDEAIQQSNRSIIEQSYISCWQMNTTESEVMWSRYGRVQPGIAVKTEQPSIAIETTASRLRQSFNEKLVDTLYIGVVKYIDRDTEAVEENGLTRFFVKSEVYQQDRELRVLLSHTPRNVNGSYKKPENNPKGHAAPVDVSVLIRRIILHPKCTPETEATVRHLISAAGLDIPVDHSRLDDVPVY